MKSQLYMEKLDGTRRRRRRRNRRPTSLHVSLVVLKELPGILFLPHNPQGIFGAAVPRGIHVGGLGGGGGGVGVGGRD